jgi:hypothetical protein
MGKYSDMPRRPRDTYDTPYSAVVPLLPHLTQAPWTHFVEPCAGAGMLVNHLDSHGHLCMSATDIAPRGTNIRTLDAMQAEIGEADCFITNPPWDRKILHPLITHLRMQAPTWLLLDSDWAFTKQSAPYMKYCRKMVAVGRVSWMENGTVGKENCAWYLFGKRKCKTQFVGR